jgi:hypothetical protein
MQCMQWCSGCSWMRAVACCANAPVLYDTHKAMRTEYEVVILCSVSLMLLWLALVAITTPSGKTVAASSCAVQLHAVICWRSPLLARSLVHCTSALQLVQRMEACSYHIERRCSRSSTNSQHWHSITELQHRARCDLHLATAKICT